MTTTTSSQSAPSPPKVKNRPVIALMGTRPYLNEGNRGVAALGLSLISLVIKQVPTAKIIALSSNRHGDTIEIPFENAKRTVTLLNFRRSPFAPWNQNIWIIVALAGLYKCLPIPAIRKNICRKHQWLSAVAEAVCIGDIRGGDSFSDIYGKARFLSSSLPVLAVLWVRGRIILFPQTYGPFRTAICRNVAIYILKRSQPVLARDLPSVALIKDLTKGAVSATFCPDVAFALHSDRNVILRCESPLLFAAGTILVGINANGLIYNGGYSRSNMFNLRMDYAQFLKSLVQTLLINPAIEVLMVPHTFAPPGDIESDQDACRSAIATIHKSLRDRVHILTGEYNPWEIKGIIGRCHFFVGSRLHSCIAALSQGIPTVGVAYSDKFYGLFASAGAAEQVIDMRQTAAEEAVNIIATTFERRVEIATALAARSAALRKTLDTTFSSILSPYNDYVAS